MMEYAFVETVYKKIKRDLLAEIYRYATKGGGSLFCRGGDLISAAPLTTGVHEPPLAALIDYYAQNGFNDCLIDIGANIGLTSCQSGHRFSEVHMYEPNPLCCLVLEANARMALDQGRFTIHKIGLGGSDKDVTLTVPRHNWGGAFVRDEENSYDESQLANKDGLRRIEANNYFYVDISIKNTAHELGGLFNRLAEKSLKNVVIKIDVEGYETSVLAGIAQALPDDMRLRIIFESWAPALKIQPILALFGDRAKAFKLEEINYNRRLPAPFKQLSLIGKTNIITKLVPVVEGDRARDIVLEIG